jgi:fatty-acyl-CoA synthase
MLRGLMMDTPLLISSLIDFAASSHSRTEVVSRSVEGPIHRSTYGEVASRARRLAKALTDLGVERGDRVGTMAWNTWRHLELYYGVSGMGAVCHTINPRLFPLQIAYIINHAEDAWLFVDLTFMPLLEGVWQELKTVKGVVVMTDAEHMPTSNTLPILHCYESLLAAQSDRYEWPRLDEWTASSLCYTSGTTGDPKGVLYSHRSTVLHALGSSLPNACGFTVRDAVMPVVPMFHVNAWGIPYEAPLAGAKLVLPGPKMDGASLYELMEQEKVTFTAGVPTLWMGLLAHMDQTGAHFSTLKYIGVGGSAPPLVMITAFRKRYGVEMMHGWGMTEMSPLGTCCWTLPSMEDWRESDKDGVRAKQGRVLYGVEMKVTSETGETLPHDGVTVGHLKVRGPWICSRYFKEDESPAHDDDGWFDTGDIATIDADGYMQITDRAKDLIKSGGEWISSIELENLAVAHPAVAEAAAIAVAHPKWGERPMLVVVRKPGASVSADEIRTHLCNRVADWWLPDIVVFTDALPHTATGKVLKSALRDQYRDYGSV